MSVAAQRRRQWWVLGVLAAVSALAVVLAGVLTGGDDHATTSAASCRSLTGRGTLGTVSDGGTVPKDRPAPADKADRICTAVSTSRRRRAVGVYTHVDLAAYRDRLRSAGWQRDELSDENIEYWKRNDDLDTIALYRRMVPGHTVIQYVWP